MFILKIGAEALKISDNSLSNDFRHSKVDKFKIPRHHHLAKQRGSMNNHGILYNLLKQKTNPGLNYDINTLLNPSSKLVSNFTNSSHQQLNPPTIIKSKPSTTLRSVRFQPYSKLKPVLLNKINCPEKAIDINPRKLTFDWLRNMVSIVKADAIGENTLCKVFHKRDSDQCKILKMSWHLIFVTYLVEFIQTNDGKMKIILGRLIKDYDKTFDNGNYKKLFRLTRVFTNDLEMVIKQMIDLKLNQRLFQIFRVAILFTDRRDNKEMKNMELLKPLLQCHSKEYYQKFDEVTENLFKLDMIMAESVFGEHLSQSVDKIIDELYSQS